MCACVCVVCVSMEGFEAGMWCTFYHHILPCMNANLHSLGGSWHSRDGWPSWSHWSACELCGHVHGAKAHTSCDLAPPPRVMVEIVVTQD